VGELAPLIAALKKINIEEKVADVLVRFGNCYPTTCLNALQGVHTLCEASQHYKTYLASSGIIPAIVRGLDSFCPRSLDDEDSEALLVSGLLAVNKLVGNNASSEKRLRQFAAAGGVHLLYRHSNKPSQIQYASAVLSTLRTVDTRKEAKEEAWRRRRHLCIDRREARLLSAAGNPWMRRASRRGAESASEASGSDLEPDAREPSGEDAAATVGADEGSSGGEEAL
jgi:hypothetical protein